MNKRQAKKRTILKNKQLIQKYPFLLPRYRCNNEILEHYNYTHTELISLPPGWEKAFGMQLLEDLKQVLIKENMLEQYRILEIKEKYGSLRWYGNIETAKITELLYKYSYLSLHTCVICGKINVPLYDDGWVSPYCEHCFKEQRKRYYKRIQQFGGTATNDENKKFKIEDANLKQTCYYTLYEPNKEEKIITLDITDILNRVGFDINSIPKS